MRWVLFGWQQPILQISISIQKNTYRTEIIGFFKESMARVQINNRFQFEMWDKISSEFSELQQSESSSFIKATNNNNHTWIASFTGPSNTALEGESYDLLFRFPINYPDSPPTVNIHSSTSGFFKQGTNIDLPILNQDWTPFFKISDIISNIESFFIEKYAMRKSEIEEVEVVSSQYTQINKDVMNMEGIIKEALGEECESPVNHVEEGETESEDIQLQIFASRSNCLKKHIDQITTECQSLEKFMNETSLTVMKNSYIKQIEDYSQLRNTLWTQYFKLFQQQIQQQLNKHTH